MAQSIIGGTFISSGAYAGQYPPGYPLLLSRSYLFGPDKIIIYHAQLILNALVTSAILFPAHFFLRDWCMKEIALAGSIIIATLPSISRTTGLIMSESLFIPLIFFALYLTYMAFKTDKQYIASIAGFLCFYAYFTRSTGIAILIALVCGLFWYCYLQQRTGASFSITLRKKWGLLVGAFIPLILWQIFLTGSGAKAVGYAEYAMPTTYIQNFGDNIIQYIQIIIFQIDYVLLTAYVVGAVIAVYIMYLILRRNQKVTDILKNSQNHEMASALCGITGFAVPLIALLAVIPLPLITSEVPFMYGRYYDPILPILFLFTLIGIQYLILHKNIAKTHMYGIFLASIATSCFVAITLQWNPHLDILQSASLPYLYLLPAFHGVAIIFFLLGFLFPLLLIMGIKNVHTMHTFLIAMLAMNIIILTSRKIITIRPKKGLLKR
jgi:hypothetical protein